MCKVSVIIPVKNGKNTIEKAAASVINGTFSDFEMIIINDGSTDDTGAVCDRLAGYDKRIKVIHTDNMGVAKARNTGIEHARGKYLAFVDADDRVSEDYLKTLVSFAQDNDLDWAACAYCYVSVDEDGNENISEEYYPVFRDDVIIEQKDRIRLYEALFFSENENNLFSNAMGIYKKSLINENNIRVNENMSYGEDLHFNLRLAEKLERFGYISRPLYHYYIYPGTENENKNKPDLLEETETLLKEIESIRKDSFTLSTAYMMWCMIRLRDIFETYIFPEEDRSVRKKYYKRLREMLENTSVSSLWECIKKEHIIPQNRYRYSSSRWILFDLLKKNRYLLIDILRPYFYERIKNKEGAANAVRKKDSK